jgi:hypothetical protein
MPQNPDEAVELTVRLHQDVHDEFASWTRSAFDEEPADYLQLLVNTLMTDQALREQLADTYLGGA